MLSDLTRLFKTHKKIASWILIAFVAVALVTGLVSARRALKGSNDFDTFYYAGRAALTDSDLYGTADSTDPAVARGPFLYPPFAACVFSIYAVLPMGAAAFAWNLTLCVLFAICIGFISKMLRRESRDELRFWQGLTVPDRVVLLVFAGALLFDNLAMAQVNILVFFLTLASLFLWKSKKLILAGCLLAAAAFIKLTPLIFCLYFFLKKEWRVLAGFVTGALFCVFLIPAVFFGFQDSQVYHRQWAERILKPWAFEFSGMTYTEPDNTWGKTALVLKHERLVKKLIPKNQSLEATMNRLFLKGQPRHGYLPYPLHPARYYSEMPIIFGGLTRPVLRIVIFAMQALLLIMLCWFTVSRKTRLAGVGDLLVLSLYFLSITLLAPWTRSHQFIVWLFPLVSVFAGLPRESPSLQKKLRIGVYGCFVLYCLQALPYGKAAGMGTWANGVLLLTSLVLLKKIKSKPA